MKEYKFSPIELDANRKNLLKTFQIENINSNIYLFKSYIQNSLTVLCQLTTIGEGNELDKIKKAFFTLINFLQKEFPVCRYLVLLIQNTNTMNQITIFFKYFSEFRIQLYSSNVFDIQIEENNGIIKNSSKFFDEILRIESYDSQINELNRFFSHIWQNLIAITKFLRISDNVGLIDMFLFLTEKISEKHVISLPSKAQENDSNIFKSLFSIGREKFDFFKKSLENKQVLKDFEKILNQYAWCINNFGLFEYLKDLKKFNECKGNINAFVYHYVYETIIQPLENLSNQSKNISISNFKTYDEFLNFLQNAEKKNNVSNKGTFYTDSNIARFMASKSISLYFTEFSRNQKFKRQYPKIIDLCSGTGVFAIALADILATNIFSNQNKEHNKKRQIESNWFSISIKIFKEMINGVDFNELAISICKIRLLFWSIQKYEFPLISNYSENTLKNPEKFNLDFTQKISTIIKILNNNFKCEDIFNRTNSFNNINSRIKKYDIIISNPPYIQEKGNKKLLDNALKNPHMKKYYQARMDFYLLFLGWAFELLQDGGTIAFITPNYFLRNLNGTLIRKSIYERAEMLYFYDFGETTMFKKAPGHHTAIYFIQLNRRSEKSAELHYNTSLEQRNKSEKFSKFYSFQKSHENISQILGLLSFNIDYYNKIDRINNDTEKIDLIKKIFPRNSSEIYSNFAKYLKIPWENLFFKKGNYEILFDYDEKLHPRLMSINSRFQPLSHYAKVKQGVITGPDRLNRKNKKLLDISEDKLNKSNRGVFILSKNELSSLNLNEEEEKFVLPFFYPKNITKQVYLNRKQNNKEVVNYVLYIDRKSNLEPILHENIIKHLIQFKPIMDSRRETKQGRIKWHELHWPRERYLFESPRIISIRMTTEPRFIYSEMPFVTDLSTNIIITENYRQLLTIFFALNCDVAKLWIRKFAKYKGNQLQIDGKFLESVPIPELDPINSNVLFILIKLFGANLNQDIKSDLYKLLNFAFNEIYLFRSDSIIKSILNYFKKHGSFENDIYNKNVKPNDIEEFHNYLLSKLKSEKFEEFKITN